MPASPALAAPSMVRGPIVGRSKRRSWPLLGAFTSTPRAALARMRPSARSRATRASSPSVPSMSSTADHVAVDHHRGLADVERTERAQHLPPPRDIGAGAGIRRSAGDAALGHQQIGRDVLDPDHAKAVLLEDAADAGQQMIVAAAKRAHDLAEHAQRAPVQPDLRQRRPHQRADEDQVAAALARETASSPGRAGRPRSSDGGNARPRTGSQAPRSANSTGVMPRAASESATANGMAPPPAITPTGEEMSEAADVMAAAIPSSLSAAVVGRKTQRAVLAVADEGEDFRNRRIFARPAAAPRSSRSAKMPGP